VETRYVVKDISPILSLRSVFSAVDTFPFQQSEKLLHHCIVGTSSHRIRAAELETMFIEKQEL
jgi:hypothetical protein